MSSSTTQFDFAARAKNSVPWQLVNRVRPEETRNSSMVSGVTCSRSDATVSAYLARWDRKDHPSKCDIALIVGPKSIAEQRSFATFD
jgi:hypothetical protein